MRLIIAEKPSQASDYAKALDENFKRREGYLEGTKTLITWCFGHLIELAKDDVYKPVAKWDKEFLPLIPEKFEYVIGTDPKTKKEDKGKKKQLDIIKSLMNKSSSLINATDADREGELIFLYVYNYLNCKLPYKRLWISSLTDEEIRKGFNNLIDPVELVNLGKSAYARAISDWQIGINGTQAVTLHLGNRNLLTIGRVQTTILKIICERYLKNKSHQKSYRYSIVATHDFKNIKFQSSTKIYETKREAETYMSKVKNTTHKFIALEEKTEKKACPLLFSIDSLIISANKVYNLSSSETLEIAQSLYQKKLTTYPRTDSKYINEEGYNKLKETLPNIADYLLDIKDFSFPDKTPKSVNAAKITGSHDAIVTTGNTNGIDKLSDNQLAIYKLIVSQCLQSFSTPAISNKKVYLFDNNDVEFKTNSSKLTDPGYLIYDINYDYTKIKDNSLDIDIERGTLIDASFEMKEIESKPPSLYTDATLTPALTNIAKFLQEEDPILFEKIKDKIDLKEVQIGTQATRPTIIEKLINIGFIAKQKKNFVPTEKGMEFYDTIKELKVCNVAYTALLEKELNDIAIGEITEEKYYNRLNTFTRKIVEDIFSIEKSLNLVSDKSFGTCPKCKKGNIILSKNKKFYGCDMYNKGCDFSLGISISSKKLSPKNVTDLVQKGKTNLIKGFTSKTSGKKFDAKLYFDKNFKIKYEFPKKEC